MRARLAFAVILFTLLAPAALLADNDHEHGDGQAGRAPVLLLEVTVGGSPIVSLAVYSDGDATLARKDADNPEGELCTAVVPAASINELEASMKNAGALRLSDSGPVLAFRNTVSFFVRDDDDNKGARTHGNTFSFSNTTGSYLAVAQAINTLVMNNFQNCI